MLEYFNIKGTTKKIIVRVSILLLIVIFGIFFIHEEKTEVQEVLHTLYKADLLLLVFGILITVIYILLQGYMYVWSFKTANRNIHPGLAINLFLKRNFISVFLPAGGISSLAFFNQRIEEQGASKAEVQFASYVYAICGILSVFIVAIPALFYAILHNGLSENEIIGFVTLTILIFFIALASYSLFQKGIVYAWFTKLYPPMIQVIEELKEKTIHLSGFLVTNFISILIEFAGITHLLIAMAALHYPINIEAALIGYVFATIFLIISPFMRGIGAIEVSLVLILHRYGYDLTSAIAITFLYRFFEFWLPLLISGLSFVLNKNNFVLRLFPATLIVLMGIVNTASTLSPAISERLHLLQNFLPTEAIQTSNIFVLFSGVFLLFISSFLLKGYRTAYHIALVLSGISLVGHLTKAIDFEEAFLALLVIISLVTTRSHYYKQGNRSFKKIGVTTALASMILALLYGVVGFYFIEHKHFAFDFNLKEAVVEGLQHFFMLGSNMQPVTHLAKNFILSINIMGFASLSFLIYTIGKPFLPKKFDDTSDQQKAKELTNIYGRSSLDYFKTYFDKEFYFSSTDKGYISYKTTKGFAIVLEAPVYANDEDLILLINEFEDFVYQNDLTAVYYRVSENMLNSFYQHGFKSLIIGQQAIVDLSVFKLEGVSNKTLRNAVNGMKKGGYLVKTYEPPIKDGVIQKLKVVSDEWLKFMEYDEIVFSQGIFNEEELKNQTIIAIESSDEKVICFINIIPDFAANEGTYDLIRRIQNIPNGAIDCLMIEMLNYFKQQGKHYVDIGFAPMAGIEQPKDLSEVTIKFAYEKIKAFSHYKGLKDYKNKFNPTWENKYILYKNTYDLIQIPIALNKVIKL